MEEKEIFEDEKINLVKAISSESNIFPIDILKSMYGNDLQSFRSYYQKNNENKHDLLIDIKAIYSGNFKKLLLALFQDPIEYDCTQLHKAMNGLITNEETLIEILGTRTPDIIRQIKEKYSRMYPGSNLLKDVNTHTSGFFKDLLISLLEAKNIEDKYSDKEAKRLAHKLAKNLFIGWAEQDKYYLEIFTKTSKNDFNKIISFYDKIGEESLTELIWKTYSFNSKKLLKAIYYREKPL